MKITKAELKRRTKNFAHRCVKLGLALPKDRLGNHIQCQLFRSSTSVAANYRAACLAQSTKSFVSKLSIVIEECDESYIWIQFAIDENLVTIEKAEDLLNEADELTAIFIASRKTIHSNHKS